MRSSTTRAYRLITSTQFISGRQAPCLHCQYAYFLRPNQLRHGRMRVSNTSSSRSESLQPRTHYDFFPESIPDGSPPQGSFRVDIQRLRKEFLQLQAAAHPDRHAGPQKKQAEALSARINEAYKTLQDPLRRAQYILSLRGIDVAEDETMKVEDQGLLMDVLEAREQIEEAQEEEDLDPLKQENNTRMTESLSALEAAFSEDNIEAAKRQAVKLRYWVNISQSIDSWEKGKPVVLVH